MKSDNQNKTAGGVAAPTQPKEVKSDLSKFVSDILPDAGNFALWTRHNKQHIWVDSHKEMIEAVQKHADMKGVYFATAAFGDEISKKTGQVARTQSNVKSRKCYHLDLDAGEAKIAKHGEGKVYVDQACAAKDLIRVSIATGLKPTYIVSSGEGLHAYYCLSEEVGGKVWKITAEAFEHLLDTHGVKQDHACTTDSARILRPIDSLHDNSKRVKILKYTGAYYTQAEFAAKVGADVIPVDECSKNASHLKRERRGINDDVLPQYDDKPADFELIKAECEVVRWAANPANQPHVEEPYWRGLLGIVKFCAGADDLAHEVSRHHPDYDREETDRKLNGWTTGPTTCEYFAGFNREACAGCKYVEVQQ